MKPLLSSLSLICRAGTSIARCACVFFSVQFLHQSIADYFASITAAGVVCGEANSKAEENYVVCIILFCSPLISSFVHCLRLMISIIAFPPDLNCFCISIRCIRLIAFLSKRKIEIISPISVYNEQSFDDGIRWGDIQTHRSWILICR